MIIMNLNPDMAGKVLTLKFYVTIFYNIKFYSVTDSWELKLWAKLIYVLIIEELSFWVKSSTLNNSKQ